LKHLPVSGLVGTAHDQHLVHRAADTSPCSGHEAGGGIDAADGGAIARVRGDAELVVDRAQGARSSAQAFCIHVRKIDRDPGRRRPIGCAGRNGREEKRRDEPGHFWNIALWSNALPGGGWCTISCGRLRAGRGALRLSPVEPLDSFCATIRASHAYDGRTLTMQSLLCRHRIACLRRWLIAALALAPVPVRASFLSGEALDTAADWLALVVIFLVPIVAIVVFWLVHILPEKIAEKKQHPQKSAIN